jgi:N-acetylglucosamine malate deacetylase 1
MIKLSIEHVVAPEQPLDMLVIAPHPDDAELGMGGTIAKMIVRGWNVGIVDLTTGEPTPHGSLEIRSRETQLANEALGSPWRINLGMTNRSLEASLDNRRLLAEVFRLTRPRRLFAPYWEDAHPDHIAATNLVEDARFWSKLTKTDMRGEPFHPSRVYYYYCIHLRHLAQPSFIVDITNTWDSKRKSVAAYHSQFIAGKEAVSPSFLEKMAIEYAYFGQAIGTAYGEPFASREPIGIDGLDGLL